MLSNLHSDDGLIVKIHFTLAMSVNRIEHIIHDPKCFIAASLHNDLAQPLWAKLVAVLIYRFHYSIGIEEQGITRLTLNTHNFVISFREKPKR